MRRSRGFFTAAAVGTKQPISVPTSQIDYGTMRVDVVSREHLLQQLAREQRVFFRENSPDYFNRIAFPEPKTFGEKVAKVLREIAVQRRKNELRDYGERMCITAMNHVNNQDWAVLFGLKEMYMEVSSWLFIIHIWMMTKRMYPIPDSKGIGKSMFKLFTACTNKRYHEIYDTAYEARRAMEWVNETYNINIVALEEAFGKQCEYRDAVLLYALYRNSPFEHREEVPFFAWYTLVQYIRLHLAVWDRIPNNEFRQGYFFFYHPLDPTLFERPDALDSELYVRELLRGKRGAQPPTPPEKLSEAGIRGRAATPLPK